MGSLETKLMWRSCIEQKDLKYQFSYYIFPLSVKSYVYSVCYKIMLTFISMLIIFFFPVSYCNYFHFLTSSHVFSTNNKKASWINTNPVPLGIILLLPLVVKTNSEEPFL